MTVLTAKCVLHKRSLFPRRWVGCRNATQSACEWHQRKLRFGGGVYVWVPLIFLVTGRYTPDYFSLWLQITMVLQLFLFLKKFKEAFLWIKWPSPRLTSQGWWVHNGIALNPPLGTLCTKEHRSVARGEVIWLCWSASVPWPFPVSHPSTHVLLHPRWRQGLGRKPLAPGESVSTTWEG